MTEKYCAPCIAASRHDFERVLAETGYSAERVRAMSEDPTNQTAFPPGFDHLRVGPSLIEGQGLFTANAIAAGAVIGPANIAGRRTPLGRYANHSPAPNAAFRRLANGDLESIALWDIPAGGEILNDYRQGAGIGGVPLDPVEVERTRAELAGRGFKASSMSTPPMVTAPIDQHPEFCAPIKRAVEDRSAVVVSGPVRACEPLPIVHVLTYCAHPTSAYGSLMVFDTIRTGFPTAQVEVWDNGSCAEVVPAIQAAALKVGARFTAMTSRHYSDHLRWVLLERPHPQGVPLVLCDPDVVFWAPVEHWDFGSAFMAGRLIPSMRHSGFTTVPRLHPSLLFIPDVHEMRAAVNGAWSRSFAWDAIGPRTSWLDGHPHFWDTLADMFNALGARCTAFGEQELDCYDHLFFGTHLPMLGALPADGLRDLCVESHRLAATEQAQALRGIWRRQQAFFETAHAGTPNLNADQVKEGMSRTLGFMAQWSGGGYSDAELWASVERMAQSIFVPTKPTQHHKEQRGESE